MVNSVDLFDQVKWIFIGNEHDLNYLIVYWINLHDNAVEQFVIFYVWIDVRYNWFIKINHLDEHKDVKFFVSFFLIRFLEYFHIWVYFNIVTHDVKFHRISDHYIFCNMMNCIEVIGNHNFVTHRNTDVNSLHYVDRVVDLVFERDVVDYWLVGIYKYMKFHLQVTVFCCFVIQQRLIAYRAVVVRLREFSFIVNYSCFYHSIVKRAFWNLDHFLFCNNNLEEVQIVCFFNFFTKFYDFDYDFFYFSCFFCDLKRCYVWLIISDIYFETFLIFRFNFFFFTFFVFVERYSMFFANFHF